MANLKSIKNRINVVKSTQKITRAMQMVAQAKVKKAENAVKSSRPFTLQLYDILCKLYKEVNKTEIEKINTKTSLENYPELLKEREAKTVALVIISANKGLAGAYCANIVRHSINLIKKYTLQGKNVALYFIGKKAIAPIKTLQNEYKFEIKNTFGSIMDSINSSSSYIIASTLADDYINQEIDEIQLVTTRYKNMMSYKAENWQMLPLISNSAKIREFRRQELDEELQIEYNGHKIEPLSEYFPDFKSVLSSAVPMYITNVIYQALLEAQASELASRMTAMSNATNTAQELISTLTIEYNKIRQAGITNEITEVISGAGALE